MIYLAIFLSKILENALATLRIILVSNGKKKSGALLQGLVMLVWILVTGYVIIDINKSIVGILALCFGAICGSYLGSIIEEKIALGLVKLNIITNNKKEVFKKLKNYKIDYDNNLYIITQRKNINDIIKIIENIDDNYKIISEKIKIYDK